MNLAEASAKGYIFAFVAFALWIFADAFAEIVVRVF